MAHRCKDMSDRARAGPVGTRFPCEICGKGLILGPGIVDSSPYGDVHYIHEISTRAEDFEKKEPCTWTIAKEGKHKYVYTRCCACASILKTGVSDVDKNGFIIPSDDGPYEDGDHYHCLHCDGCGYGNYPYLDGWKRRAR